MLCLLEHHAKAALVVDTGVEADRLVEVSALVDFTVFVIVGRA